MQTLQLLQTVREAVNARLKLRLDYCDLSGSASQRVDRIARLDVLDDRFKEEPEKTLSQMLHRLGATFNT